MSWNAIAGCRLVTQAPDRLAAFSAACGFAIGESEPIARDEMASLGLSGTGERRAMRLGEARLDLDRFAEGGAPYPEHVSAASPLFQHCALVTDNVAAAWQRARAVGARPIGADRPVTLPASSGSVTAIKFRDPEGHPLELIAFPDAAAKGYRGTGLLGIDHSAIVVPALDAALHFFRALGLDEGDRTLNVGAEQDALDGVDGAHVDVVPLAPPAPRPHLELLHYRHPVAPTPQPPQVADVAATRIVWRGGAAGLVRDPAGHLHQLVP